MQDTVSALLKQYNPTDAEEHCGLVMTDGSLVEIPNIHPEPTKGFRMDPKQLLAQADQAIGTWHTHPDASPNLSEEDYAGFLAWPKLKHFIVGVLDRKLTVKAYQVDAGLVVGVEP